MIKFQNSANLHDNQEKKQWQTLCLIHAAEAGINLFLHLKINV